MAERIKGYKGDLSRQFSFDIAGEVCQPQTLEHLTQLPHLLNTLGTQKLWNGRPKGKIFIDNFQTEQGFVFSSATGVADYQFTLPTPSVREKFSAGIVAFPDWENTILFSDFLVQIHKKLKPAAPIIIVEQLPQGSSRNPVEKEYVADMWKGLAQEAGFVHIDTVAKNGILLCRAAIPRERKPVDLVRLWGTSDNSQRRNFIPEMLGKIGVYYEKHGLKVVDNSEMVNRLSNSTYVPADINNLKMGHGIVVEDQTCHCRWHIDLNGNMDIVEAHCREHGNTQHIPSQYRPDRALNTRPYYNPLVEKVLADRSLLLAKDRTLEETCPNMGCGSSLILDNRLIERKKRKDGDILTVSIEIRCPHCGVVCAEKVHGIR